MLTPDINRNYDKNNNSVHTLVVDIDSSEYL